MFKIQIPNAQNYILFPRGHAAIHTDSTDAVFRSKMQQAVRFYYSYSGKTWPWNDKEYNGIVIVYDLLSDRDGWTVAKPEGDEIVAAYKHALWNAVDVMNKVSEFNR